jgi:hypothetical protein
MTPTLYKYGCIKMIYCSKTFLKFIFEKKKMSSLAFDTEEITIYLGTFNLITGVIDGFLYIIVFLTMEGSVLISELVGPDVLKRLSSPRK